MAEHTGRRTGPVLAAAALAAVAGWAVRDIPAALGARPSGERAERMRRSPQFRDGVFHNPVPARMLPPGSTGQAVRAALADRDRRRPVGEIPVLTPQTPEAPAGGLFITWYGHSSALIELDGRRVLLDPVFSDRCSPSRLVGPRRLHRPPLALKDLPPLDAVVISHDHYDHLDMPTVRALVDLQSAPFLVPLGVGAHLQRWGVPPVRIVELDWQESATVGGVEFTATPARHFSGRGLKRDGTLWASWVIARPERRVFYSGDTGYFPGFADIGALHGPFDATVVQVGAYGDAWPDIHMLPEEGVATHLDVRGGLLVPVHWCTFNLAFHHWSEPAERVWREAKARDVRLAVPRPGQRVDVDDPPQVDGWWQAIA